jgi:cyclohexadienyl dehydratase
MIRTSVLAAVVATAAALMFGPAPAAAQAQQNSKLERILKAGVLRVGTTGDYNPMSFRDPATKELAGHQIDAARELAKDMGVKVEFVPTDWKTLVQGVQAGQYDIAMTGASMSVARAKTAGFTTPWGRNAFFPLVLKKNAQKFKTWDDLNQPSVTAGFNLGTTMEQFVQSTLPKSTVRRVESPARDWQELLAGRVDYVVTSLIEGSSLIKQYPDMTLMFLDQPRNSIPMSFVVPIDDQIWINFVNNWVTIKRQNGYFAELNKKWGIIGQD